MTFGAICGRFLCEKMSLIREVVLDDAALLDQEILDEASFVPIVLYLYSVFRE